MNSDFLSVSDPCAGADAGLSTVNDSAITASTIAHGMMAHARLVFRLGLMRWTECIPAGRHGGCRATTGCGTARHAETRRTKYRNADIFINGKMLTQNQNIYAGNRDDNECSFPAVPSNGPSENAEIPPLYRYNGSTETADKGVPPAPPYVPVGNDARRINRFSFKWHEPDTRAHVHRRMSGTIR